MIDEQGQQEGIPIEKSPLFAEAARKAERRNAAKVVLDWLEGKRGDQTVEKITKVSLGQMAREMIERLQEGGIFFAVKNSDKIGGPVDASRDTLKIRPGSSDSGYGGVAVQQELRGYLIILKVRKGVTPKELSQSDDKALAEIYILDKSTTQYRVRVSDLNQVNIKDPDIGPFPKLS